MVRLYSSPLPGKGLAVSHGDYLRHDRDRNFGRCPATDVKTDRTVQTVKLGFAQAQKSKALAP